MYQHKNFHPKKISKSRQTFLKRQRILSMLLCMLLLLFSCSFTITALETPEQATSTESNVASTVEQELSFETTNRLELGEGELPFSQLQELDPKDVQRPETVSLEQAIEKGHVNRLYAQETSLQTVIFQNQNGSKTSYIFDKPVKYITTDGIIKDKNTKIEATGLAGYAYAMTDNSFQAYFGKAIATNGVRIQYGNYSFVMKAEPSSVVATPQLSTDGKSVTYNGAFGAMTAVRYQTQLFGIKEDIILRQDIGKYTFRFLLTATEVMPVQKEAGQWMLVNDAGECVFDFGNILIKDSVGNATYGTLEITERTSGGYIMTIHVPQEFLRSSSTVYPVYIDPTVVTETGFYYTYEGSESFRTDYQAIEDMTVYSHGDLYYDLELPMFMDQHLFYDGMTTVIYRFADFYNLQFGKFVDMPAEEIDNVTLYLKAASSFSGTFDVYPMLEYVDYWYDFTYDPGLAIHYETEACHSSTTVTNAIDGTRIPIDITEIARAWTDNTRGITCDPYNFPEYGIALRFGNETAYIYATEADGDSNVYYEVTHSEPYYIHNQQYGTMLYATASENNQVINTVSGKSFNAQYCTWKLIAPNSSKPVIAIIHNGITKYLSVNSLGHLSLSSTPYYWTFEPAESSGIHIVSKSGKILYQQEGGYIDLCDKNNFTYDPNESDFSEANANYLAGVWKYKRRSDYTKLQAFTVDAPLWFDKTSTSPISISGITPADADWVSYKDFHFTISRNIGLSITHYGADDDDKNNAGDENDEYTKTDGQPQFNFSSSSDLRTTNITVTHVPTGKTVVCPLSVGQILADGTYLIRNCHSKKYIEPKNGLTADNHPIWQNSYQNTLSEKWKITYIENGYYTICSAASQENKYLSIEYVSTPHNSSILLTSTENYDEDTCLWLITKTTRGNYRLTPKGDTTSALSLASRSKENEILLQQAAYTDNAYLEDEWFVSYDATMLAYNDMDPDHPRHEYMSLTRSVVEDVSGCENIYTGYEIQYSKTEVQSLLENSKLFIIHTHGNTDRVFLGHDESGNEYRYYLSDLLNIDFSNTKLVIYLTCRGSKGYINEDRILNGTPQNVLEATRCAGAETVIAFKESTNLHACNKFMEDLIVQMYNNGNERTLQEAFDRLKTLSQNEKSQNKEQEQDIYYRYDYTYTIPATEAHPIAESWDLLEIAVLSGNTDITLSDLFGNEIN